MLSENGDVRELLRALVGQPFADVVSRITVEKRAAEALAKRCRAQPALQATMFAYTHSCRGLKWWLTTKTKPRNCADFLLFRALTAALVDRGELPPTMLESFG